MALCANRISLLVLAHNVANSVPLCVTYWSNILNKNNIFIYWPIPSSLYLMAKGSLAYG